MEEVKYYCEVCKEKSIDDRGILWHYRKIHDFKNEQLIEMFAKMLFDLRGRVVKLESKK